MSRSRTGFVLILAAVAAVLLGGAMLALGWPADVVTTSSRQWATGDWRTTGGRVVESTVWVASLPGGAGPTGIDTVYSPVIRYTYIVDGRPYSSEQVHAGGPHLSLDRAGVERIVADWPPGRAVTVRYDARNPRRSTLLAGAVRWPGYALIALGILLGPIGLLLRRRRAEPAAT